MDCCKQFLVLAKNITNYGSFHAIITIQPTNTRTKVFSCLRIVPINDLFLPIYLLWEVLNSFFFGNLLKQTVLPVK